MNFALMRGATVVTLPRFELEPFLKVLQEWPIALAHIVPPVAVALAKHPLVDKYNTSTLRAVLSGAAPLDEDLGHAVADRIGCPVVQGYGMRCRAAATARRRRSGRRTCGRRCSSPRGRWR